MTKNQITSNSDLLDSLLDGIASRLLDKIEAKKEANGMTFVESGRSHGRIRGLMEQYNVKRDDLASHLQCSAVHITDCMTYKREWRTGEMYKICDFFNSMVGPHDQKPMPYDRIHEFFPPKKYYKPPQWPQPKGA